MKIQNTTHPCTSYGLSQACRGCTGVFFLKACALGVVKFALAQGISFLPPDRAQVATESICTAKDHLLKQRRFANRHTGSISSRLHFSVVFEGLYERFSRKVTEILLSWDAGCWKRQQRQHTCLEGCDSSKEQSVLFLRYAKDRLNHPCIHPLVFQCPLFEFLLVVYSPPDKKPVHSSSAKQSYLLACSWKTGTSCAGLWCIRYCSATRITA